MTSPYNLQRPVPLTDFEFLERSGLELLHLEPGRAVVRMPREPNVNHVGMMYAGALFTAAEVPGGALFRRSFDRKRFYPVVGDLQITFLRPATGAVIVDARMSTEEIERVRGELEERGKARFVLEQEVLDEDGNVVATTRATYHGRSY